MGQIVGLQSEEIKQIASEYAEKVSDSHSRVKWLTAIIKYLSYFKE